MQLKQAGMVLLIKMFFFDFRIYRKAQVTPKKEVKYVVVRKHTSSKRVPRPKGVVGRYKLVDPRMKKDLRSMKNKEKTKNRGKKHTRGGNKPAGKKPQRKGKDNRS